VQFRPVLFRPVQFHLTFKAALLVLSTLPSLVYADGAGAYLAARHGEIENDFAKAAEFANTALIGNPDDLPLMESAVMAQISLGQIDRALAVARLLVSRDPNNQIANLAIATSLVRNKEYTQLYELTKNGEAIGPLVDGLLAGWAQFGAGRMSEALALFDVVAEEPGLSSFGLYHKALALMLAGDFEAADAILSQQGTRLPATRRGVMAQAQVLSQLERNADAAALIDGVFGRDLDPGLALMRAQLVAGDTLDVTAVRSVRDGMAEVFFSVARALEVEADANYTLLYTRVSQALRPDLVEATLLAAALLDQLEQFDLATAAYDSIPESDPAFQAAELGRASALRRSGKQDAAIEVLTRLSERNPELSAVHIALGDVMRGNEDYPAAIAAYARAVDLIDTPAAGDWAVYFARGIAYERNGDWPDAEADFRQALALQPNQPRVLNYLGYSYVEKQQNLDEALAMIVRAVEQRPGDGFITDSLGWVLYRLGRYEEAVLQMERAVELMPVDPILNDHLGDVYWAVGRKREARFQWRRALSFDPEEVDATRIRRKLDIGLDAVLAAEGAAPLDGN
jgi:tetratricopeptide (TPR) repeat protein